jgi:hypothetical protein
MPPNPIAPAIMVSQTCLLVKNRPASLRPVAFGSPGKCGTESCTRSTVSRARPAAAAYGARQPAL